MERTGFHHHFFTKIPKFPFRKNKQTNELYYHLRQMFSLKATLAFFREERAFKSSHFMALSPFCITNHCTAIPHPELGHYSFHGFGLWQNRFLSKNHQKDLYKTKRLLTTKKKKSHLQFLRWTEGSFQLCCFLMVNPDKLFVCCNSKFRQCRFFNVLKVLKTQ